MITEVLAQLEHLDAKELRLVIKEAKMLLSRKPLYIRELGKPTAQGRTIYLYATWQEEGKTKQKSLGRKLSPDELAQNIESENMPLEFKDYGLYSNESIVFVQSMLENGYYLANRLVSEQA